MMNRFWVNQPSKLQPDHELHGTLVLADPSNGRVCGSDRIVRAYRTSGDVIDSEVFLSSLSEGWPSHLRK